MSTYLLALLAAFACALCNGIAAVLQKVSADKEKTVESLDAKLLWRLIQDKPYIIGTSLDFIGWIFTLIAVQYLPLFLVESVIAFGIVVTALVERIFRHQAISLKSYVMIVIIVIGLILLALASTSQRAKPISDSVKYFLLIMPVPIALVSIFVAKNKAYIATISLAILSGLAFGGTSIVGRIFRFSHPLWQTIYSPVTLAIIVSGVLGILLFSVSLQRAKATIVNAAMTTSQTVVPAIIGIIFFGDAARNGMWYLVVLGTLLALLGVTFLSLGQGSNS